MHKIHHSGGNAHQLNGNEHHLSDNAPEGGGGGVFLYIVYIGMCRGNPQIGHHFSPVGVVPLV